MSQESQFLIEETPIAPIRSAMEIALALPSSVKAEIRLQQHQFIYTCAEAIRHGRDVVIEGPTGLGKTRSVLASVIPFLRNDPDARVLYLTRTITQIDNILREINEICEVSTEGKDLLSSVAVFGVRHMPVKAECWVARDEDSEPNTCFSCDKNNPWDRLEETGDVEDEDAYDEISKNVGTPQYFDFADESYICPLRLMDYGVWNHRIVVATQQRIFDSAWTKNWFGDLKNTVVVIDEAHNFLADASSTEFLRIGYGIDRLKVGLENNSFVFGRDEEEEEPRRDDRWPKYELDCKVRDFFADIVSIVRSLTPNFYLDEKGEKRLFEDCYEFSLRYYSDNFSYSDQEIIDDANDIKDMDDNSGRNNDEGQGYVQLINSIRCVAKNPYEFFMTFDAATEEIAFTAIHPRVRTNFALSGAHSLIFTSATMSPVSDVAMLLGRPNALQVRLGHMFPEENYAHFFVLGAHSSAGGEERDQTFSLAEEHTIRKALEKCFSAAAGRNIGIFCSSFQVMDSVIKLIKKYKVLSSNAIFIGDIGKSSKFDSSRSWLKEGWKQLETVLQRNLPSDPVPTDLISPFMEMGDHSETTVLLGVQGGSLSEGVDYKGKTMEMVINIGLPYPASGAELQVSSIKHDYWGMHFDQSDNFDVDDITYKQEAFRKLAQSAGRGHRNKSDRSVIVFVDERLLALKNDGMGGYQRLSVRNAAKNLKMLQPPLQKIEKNIVVDPDNRILAAELSSWFRQSGGNMMFAHSDIIGFDTMHEQIVSFYKGQ